MARITLFLVSLFWVVIPLAAQNTSPDYSIQLIQSSFSEDIALVIVKFDVLNEGASTSQATTATLDLIETGEQVAVVDVPPLGAGERFAAILTFATAPFAPNSVESFRAAVGVGDIESADSQSVRDNSAVIQITFPATIPAPVVTPESVSGQPLPTDEPATGDFLDQVLDSLNIRIDRSDPVQIAVAAGVIGALVLLLLIVVIIVRLLFQRPPTFGNWQPPYANLVSSDTSTIAGRRQQWQMHAQNSALTPTGSEGSLQVRKLPTDANGHYLARWQILALRLSQYDMYGRVNRSEIMLTSKLIRRLDWVARKRGRLSSAQMTRHLRPVAKHLSRQVRKRLNERNAGLPLVLDVRLRARYGQAQIWFELFHSQRGRWIQIDRWQAEMVVPGKMIYESFTYTLYGQRPGELLKPFQKRLEDDLIQLFVDMLNPPVSVTAPRPEAPTDPHLQAVQPSV